MLAIFSGWGLDVQRGPDWLLVKITSRPDDLDETSPLAEVLWDLMQRHLSHRLVLELDEIEVLDSRIIGQLVRLYKRIHERDGVMRLCGLSAYNLGVLKTCRLDDRFFAYHDREEAVMACRRPHAAK